LPIGPCCKRCGLEKSACPDADRELSIGPEGRECIAEKFTSII
jgi:hypothetical protein